MLRGHIRALPASPGVYRMLGADGAPLYVGKAKNLKKRVASYTQRARLPVRLQRMVSLAQNLEVTITRTEADALLLEASYIRNFLPPYNILLRDDKSYPYILIAKEDGFPRLAKHRGAREAKGWYFGPFASGAAVTETLTLLQKVFMLRTCREDVFSNRSRPCLLYHIKRCTAPCVGCVGKEAYAEQVSDAVDFLRGKNQDVQKKMAAEMQAASDAMDYEKAAGLRDRIKVLTSVQTRQNVHVPGLSDADVMALYRTGGKTAVQVFFFRQGRNYGARLYYPSHDADRKEEEVFAAFIAQFYADKSAPPLILTGLLPERSALLEEALSKASGHKVRIAVPRAGARKRLVDGARRNAEESLGRVLSGQDEQKRLMRRVEDAFGLSKPLKRIEVYDNSHTGGTFAVGAMIAAGEEGFLKKTYRKFSVREAAPDDDVGMMREVLTRRFKRLIAEDPKRESGLWPGLLLIDGGAGQVNKAQETLKEIGLGDIAIIGIAKGPDRNAGRERFFRSGNKPFSFETGDPVLYFLQRLRDEAHRFAIGAHRARRGKELIRSRLDGIPGVGAARKRTLLRHFGSAKAVAEADIEDLMRVEGISRGVAQKIVGYFRTT